MCFLSLFEDPQKNLHKSSYPGVGDFDISRKRKMGRFVKICEDLGVYCWVVLGIILGSFGGSFLGMDLANVNFFM